MLAGQTLYRDSRERNRKKTVFFYVLCFFMEPRQLFLVSVAFEFLLQAL